MKIKLLFLIIFSTISFSQTIIFQDNMNGDNSITGLQARGWVVVDNDGGGTTPAWFQGNDSIFSSQEGPVNGYVAANFRGANESTGLIDHWLISPSISYTNGDTLYFYMRSPDGSTFRDSVSTLFSPNADTSLANFITVGNRLESPIDGWGLFFATFNFTGSIRFALRYLIFDGGELGNSSDFLGIDVVVISHAGTTYPTQITLNKSYTFGDVTKNTSYRLIGLPGNINLPVSNFTSGTHKKDWNVFYDNGAEPIALLEFNGQATFNFTPGKGFWA